MQPADAVFETLATADRDTATVSFTLLGLERARDCGRLIGLASAEILLAGDPRHAARHPRRAQRARPAGGGADLDRGGAGSR